MYPTANIEAFEALLDKYTELVASTHTYIMSCCCDANDLKAVRDAQAAVMEAFKAEYQRGWDDGHDYED